MPTKINLMRGYRDPWHVFARREVKLQPAMDREVHRFFRMFDSPNRHLVLNPDSRADVRLLVQDKLGHYPHLWKSYCGKYGPFLIEIYEQFVSGDRIKMPKFTFDGFQGLINAIILTRHVLEKKCGLEMREAGRLIDPRLHSRYQEDFLSHALGRKDKLRWIDFAGMYRLHTPFQKMGTSALRMFEYCYPWAFNLSTPEGHHLHAWDFIAKGNWENEEGVRLAVVALRHVFEKHLGFVMDMESRTIDPRFFPGNYAGFLREEGVQETIDLLEKHRISGVLDRVEKFRHKYVDAYMAAWPWAFDIMTPEGKHLHYWDFFGKGFRAQGREQVIMRGRHVLESHFGLKMNERTGRIDNRLLENGGKRFLAKAGYDNWSDFMAYSRIHWAFKDSGILGEDFTMVGCLRELYPWAFDLEKPEGKHVHFWRLINESRWSADAMRSAILHSLKEDGLSASDLPVVEKLWFRRKGMGGIFDRFGAVVRIARYAMGPEFDDGTLTEDMFKAENMRLVPPFLKVTSYVSDFYGKATIDGRHYCFPKKYIGLFARRISSDYGGLYSVDAGPEGSVISRKLIYLFRLSDAESYDAVHVKDSDLVTFQERPLPDLQLLEDVNTVFIGFGRSVYYFPMSEQIKFASLYRIKGPSGLRAALKKMFSS